ncbi:MAG: sigma-70 family RNA polymerase sigma factor [Acidimicrobiales bacterium]
MIIQSALEYVRQGWRVLPLNGISERGTCTCRQGADCSSPGKHPLVNDWRKAATTDTATITGWFDHWPRANLGLVTGEIFDVIDIDSDEGIEQVKLALSRDDLRALSATPHVRTGRQESGWHYYVEPTGLRQGAKLLPGVDIRTVGGYVVAPPSRHISGAQYHFTNSGPASPLVAAPAPILLALDRSARHREPPPPPAASDLSSTSAASSSGRRTWGTGDKRFITDPERYTAAAVRDELAHLVGAPAGAGNDTLNGVAFRLYQFVYGGTLDEDECASMLREAMRERGQRLQRPVNEMEVTRTLESAQSAASFKRDGGLAAANDRQETRHRASAPPRKARAMAPIDAILAHEDKGDHSAFQLTAAILASAVTKLTAAGFTKDKAVGRVVAVLRRDAPPGQCALLAEGSRVAGGSRGLDGDTALTFYLHRGSRWSSALPGPHEAAAEASLRALTSLLGEFEPGDNAIKPRLKSLAETASRPSELLLSILHQASPEMGSSAPSAEIAAGNGGGDLENVQSSGSAPKAAVGGQSPEDEVLLARLVLAAASSRGYPGEIGLLNRQVTAESHTSHERFVAACRKASGGSTLAETLADSGPLAASRLFVAAWNDLNGRMVFDPKNVVRPSPPEHKVPGLRAKEMVDAIAASSPSEPLEIGLPDWLDAAEADRLVSTYGLGLSLRQQAVAVAGGEDLRTPSQVDFAAVGEQSLPQGTQEATVPSPPTLTLVPALRDASAPVMDPRSLLRAVSRLPDLAKMTTEQTNELVELARGADPALASDAKDVLVRRLLPVIGHAVAKLDIKSKADRDDAHQAALLRTLYCIENFDPSAGMKLSTYVYGSSKRAAINWIQRERGELYGSSEEGRERVPARSLDAPAHRIVDDGDAIGLADVIADSKIEDPIESAAAARRVKTLADLVAGLPDRQRQVVTARHGLDGKEPKRFEEIGPEIGLTYLGAQRIYEQAIASLHTDPAAAALGEGREIHEIPARTLQELVADAQKNYREKKSGVKAVLDTEITVVVDEERLRHPNSVAAMDRRYPEGLKGRIAKVLAEEKESRRQSRKGARTPVQPPANVPHYDVQSMSF